MKRCILSIMISAVVAVSCASVTAAGSSNEIPEKEWKLIEVYVNGRNTGFNRASLNRGGAEMFTLTFKEGMVGGAGAPNRYNAPYTAGENKTVSIALVRATLMASILEPSSLREHDFFNYIQGAYKWNVINNNFELYSKLENGSEIRLVFSL